MHPKTIQEIRRKLPHDNPGSVQPCKLRDHWRRFNSDGSETKKPGGWAFTLCLN